MTPEHKKQLVLLTPTVALDSAAYLAWILLRPSRPGEDFVSGNDRIEAAEIHVATSSPVALKNCSCVKATSSPPANRWPACN